MIPVVPYYSPRFPLAPSNPPSTLRPEQALKDANLDRPVPCLKRCHSSQYRLTRSARPSVIWPLPAFPASPPPPRPFTLRPPDARTSSLLLVDAALSQLKVTTCPVPTLLCPPPASAEQTPGYPSEHSSHVTFRGSQASPAPTAGSVS